MIVRGFGIHDGVGWALSEGDLYILFVSFSLHLYFRPVRVHVEYLLNLHFVLGTQILLVAWTRIFTSGVAPHTFAAIWTKQGCLLLKVLLLIMIIDFLPVWRKSWSTWTRYIPLQVSLWRHTFSVFRWRRLLRRNRSLINGLVYSFAIDYLKSFEKLTKLINLALPKYLVRSDFSELICLPWIAIVSIYEVLNHVFDVIIWNA